MRLTGQNWVETKLAARGNNCQENDDRRMFGRLGPWGRHDKKGRTMSHTPPRKIARFATGIVFEPLQSKPAAVEIQKVERNEEEGILLWRRKWKS